MGDSLGIGNYNSNIYYPASSDDDNYCDADIDETNSLNSENAWGGVNKLIDESTYQGQIGDCWFLSSVLSLSYNENGQEIIKNSITQNENGDYVIKYKGIDKSCTVTQAELQKARESGTYSSGDDDMLLLEVATEKLISQEDLNITRSGLSGGKAYKAYDLFSEDTNSYCYTIVDDTMSDCLDYLEQNQDTCSGVLGINNSFNDLPSSHAYAIKSYDGETMHVVNPWDSTSDIEISKEDLVNNYGNFGISMISYSDNENTPAEIYGDTLGEFLGYELDKELDGFETVIDTGESIVLDDEGLQESSILQYGYEVKYDDNGIPLYYKEKEDGTISYARNTVNENGQIDLKVSHKYTDGTSSTYYYKYS